MFIKIPRQLDETHRLRPRLPGQEDGRCGQRQGEAQSAEEGGHAETVPRGAAGPGACGDTGGRGRREHVRQVARHLLEAVS